MIIESSNHYQRRSKEQSSIASRWLAPPAVVYCATPAVVHRIAPHQRRSKEKSSIASRWLAPPAVKKPIPGARKNKTTQNPQKVNRIVLPSLAE